MLEDHIYPTDFFPFTTVTARDPVTGSTASVLDRPRQFAAVPKLFYVNASSEYWNRAASLITTDPAGERDLPPAPEARIYAIAGAQHYVGITRHRGTFNNCGNPLNHYRVLRALLVALDRWVREGAEPPASSYPQIADGTLISVEAYKRAFPPIPHFRLPEDQPTTAASRFRKPLRYRARCRRNSAPYRPAVCDPGAEAGRRRARSGWHCATRDDGAARYTDRLQYPN